LENFNKFINEKVQSEQEVHLNVEKLQSYVKNLRLLTNNLIDVVAKWREILGI
jgi:hypothetical protein